LRLEVSEVAGGIKIPDLEPAGEAAGRAVIGRIAALASAAALKASAPSAVTEAFIKTRLVAGQGAIYGTGGIASVTADQLLARALPESYI
jgi:hypothetical protein